MSVLNKNFYAVQTTGKIDLSYPYNPSTESPYKQNYLNGILDPSIWLLSFDDSIYSFCNSYMTIALTATQNNQNEVKIVNSKNRYNKKLWRPAKSLSNCMHGNSYNSGALWFPNAILPTCNANFWLSYDYGNTVLFPTFTAVNTLTGAQITNVDYNTLTGYGSEYLVIAIQLGCFNGAVGSQTGRNSSTQFFPYAQFAGEIIGAGNNNIISRENYRGTFYFSDSSYILRLNPYIWRQNKTNGLYQLGGVYNSAPYAEDLFVKVTREDDSYIYTHMGLTIKEAGHVVTALGHYWGKTRESALNSATGTHCTDPNIVGAKIDGNNKIIFNDPDNDTYEGTQISDIANADPNSNFNWGAGAENLNGKDTEEIQENTNPENSEDVEETELNENTYSTSGAFNSAYAVSETTLNAIAQWLWNGSPDMKWDTILSGLSLMGENPINAVTSIKLFPIDLNLYADTGAYETIYIGKESTSIMGRKINKSNIIIDLGEMYYNVADNYAFLNYEPYSSCNLYIPYCGILQLSPTEIINHTISVKMIIDLITGACTGVVFIDGYAFAYKDGVIGVEIPLTGANMSTYFSNILGGAMGGATAGTMVGGTIGGIMTSPYMAVTTTIVGGVVGGMSGALAGQAKGTTISKTGASSPSCSMAQPQYCYLIFETPVEIEKMTNYGHTNGFLSYRTEKISNLLSTGFSVFANVDTTSISKATLEERAEIKTLLESGVYL